MRKLRLLLIVLILLLFALPAQAGKVPLESGVQVECGIVTVTSKSSVRCPECKKAVNWEVDAFGVDGKRLYVKFCFSCESGCRISDYIWRGTCRNGARKTNEFSWQKIYVNHKSFYGTIVYNGCGSCGAHSNMTLKVPAFCGEEGVTLETCVSCGVTSRAYNREPANSHWFGEWHPESDGTHTAACKRRGCEGTKTVACEVQHTVMPDGSKTQVCPVCGIVSTGERLMLVEATWENRGYYPVYGDLTVRVGELKNGQKLMTACYELGGVLRAPKNKVRVTVADMSHVMNLLDAQGNITELDVKHENGKAIFELEAANAHLMLLDPVRAYKRLQMTIY